MSNAKKFPGKPLMSRWQEVMRTNQPPEGQQFDPMVVHAMHAMFMFGAMAVAAEFSSMEEGNVETGVKEITDELNSWADTMRLAVMPLASGAKN